MTDLKKDPLGLKKYASPHEALVRALLSDPHRVKGLLGEMLPHEVLALFSDELPVHVEGRHVDEELRASQTDMLFRVNLKAGGIAFIFILFEHREKPDPRTPLQLMKCQVRIWEDYAKDDDERLKALPPIIPLVIYHGARPWDLPSSVAEMIQAEAPLRDLSLRPVGPGDSL